MLRQVVGDLEPEGLARYIEVAFQAYSWVVIETANGNSEFRVCSGRFTIGEPQMRQNPRRNPGEDSISI